MDGAVLLTSRIVDIESLTVQYGNKRVLNDVSVSVRQGDILGVLGPNGAGKSTMFRAMLGLLPYRGRISFFGADAGERRHLLPFVGYVPQKIDFEPLFPATVHDVVSMGVVSNRKRRRGLALLEINGLAAKYYEKSDGTEDMVEGALETVGMSSMRDSRIGALSGGQRQRVFIAQSLVRNPLLMIMDEPVSSMDVESQSLFYSAVRQSARGRQITVIISLHDLDMLREHTSKVMFLNRTLTYYGDTEEFFADRDRVRMYTEASMHAGGHTHGA